MKKRKKVVLIVLRLLGFECAGTNSCSLHFPLPVSRSMYTCLGEVKLNHVLFACRPPPGGLSKVCILMGELHIAFLCSSCLQPTNSARRTHMYTHTRMYTHACLVLNLAPVSRHRPKKGSVVSLPGFSKGQGFASQRPVRIMGQVRY